MLQISGKALRVQNHRDGSRTEKKLQFMNNLKELYDHQIQNKRTSKRNFHFWLQNGGLGNEEYEGKELETQRFTKPVIN